MKVTTTAGQLSETISVAANITPNRPQLTAYSGVLVSATRGRLAVRGTNGETTVTSMCRVSDVTEGQVLIPPGPLTRYLNALPPETPITVEVPSTTQLVVSATGAKPYKFTALADSFPTSTVPRLDKVEADLSMLDEAVSVVAACAEVLSGSAEKVVQLVSDANGLRLHATDRFRVARAALPTSSGFGEFDGLLPLRVLSLAASINPTHVQIDTKGRTIVFHAENTVVSARLIPIPFPVVDSVLAATPPYRVQLDRTATLAAMKRLSAVVPPKGAVKIVVSGDLFTLEIPQGSSGSGEESLTLAAAAGAELETAVSFEFLKTVLESHHSDDVTFGWSAPHQALFFSSTDPVPATHAVMPVKL